MALLFADEDVPLPVVERLRQLGHDAITAADAGLANIGTDDEAILAAAVRLGRVVVTMNRRDFIALHTLDPNHEGIVVCTRDPDTSSLADRIHTALSRVSATAGQLVRVNRPNPPSPKGP